MEQYPEAKYPHEIKIVAAHKSFSFESKDVLLGQGSLSHTNTISLFGMNPNQSEILQFRVTRGFTLLGYKSVFPNLVGCSTCRMRLTAGLRKLTFCDEAMSLDNSLCVQEGGQEMSVTSTGVGLRFWGGAGQGRAGGK